MLQTSTFMCTFKLKLSFISPVIVIKYVEHSILNIQKSSKLLYSENNFKLSKGIGEVKERKVENLVFFGLGEFLEKKVEKRIDLENESDSYNEKKKLSPNGRLEERKLKEVNSFSSFLKTDRSKF